MSWRRGWWLRLRALLSRGAVERELREELDFHLAMDTETGLERGLNALWTQGGLMYAVPVR